MDSANLLTYVQANGAPGRSRSDNRSTAQTWERARTLRVDVLMTRNQQDETPS